jgi:hypothetical protein
VLPVIVRALEKLLPLITSLSAPDTIELSKTNEDKFTVCTVGNTSNVRLPFPFSLTVWLLPESTLDGSFTAPEPPVNSKISKLMSDKSDFAKALGTGEITVGNNSIVSFLWFDNDTKQAVFGYSDENSDTAAENKIKDADTFTEIVRLNMTESSYTHFLDADNFVFI